MTNVFTYGSLMYPEVFGPVTLASPRCHRTRLDGWSRHAIRGRSYPGAVPAIGASIEGVLWMELDEDAMQRLDQFEGDEYARERVVVTLPGGEVLLSALVEPWARRLQLLVVRLDGAPAALSRRERAALELTLYRRCAAAAAAELVELDAAEKLPS